MSKQSVSPPLGPIRSAAVRNFEKAVRAGAKAYDRACDLPALIRTDPFAPLPDGESASLDILTRLERALRAERNKARAGHWTYDLNRHIALRQAHLAEAERLQRLFPRLSGEPAAKRFRVRTGSA